MGEALTTASGRYFVRAEVNASGRYFVRAEVKRKGVSSPVGSHDH